MELRAVIDAIASDDALTWTLVDPMGERIDLARLVETSIAGRAIRDVTFDSRAVVEGSLFICKGAAFAETYLKDAVRKGALCYLAESPHPGCGIVGIVVNDVRRAMARVACAFFNNPSRCLRVVGLTGTKGKTTIAFYIDSILKARGADCVSGMFTGLVIDDGLMKTVSHNTTPESVELQRHLANAVAAGCDTVVMEASSQGLKYDRTLGTHFSVGVFTNIGEDHISLIEHPTFEDYFASKLRLFDDCSCAVVNLDTQRAGEVLSAAAVTGRILTYAMRPDAGADICLIDARRAGEGGWELVLGTPAGERCLHFEAMGRFNVSNALAAVAVSYALGVPWCAVETGLKSVRVPGRMERYDAPDGSLVGIVDYAHNEMSMEALLRSAREDFPGRQITVVFGSTGERATHRREGLGRAAGRFADRIILTEDDPGSVPVGLIAEEIGRAVLAQGKTYEVVENRVEAVHRAVSGAQRPGVIVLAGKGAEDMILRAGGSERCKTDAQLICEEFGLESMA